MYRSTTKFLLTILLFLVSVSCGTATYPKKKVVKGFVGIYVLDTTNSDQCAKELTKQNDLKLILKDDGTYEFSPSIEVLKEYEGEWYVQVFYDTLGNLIFECKNGDISENGFYFKIKTETGKCLLRFRNKAKDKIMKKDK